MQEFITKIVDFKLFFYIFYQLLSDLGEPVFWFGQDLNQNLEPQIIIILDDTNTETCNFSCCDAINQLPDVCGAQC